MDYQKKVRAMYTHATASRHYNPQEIMTHVIIWDKGSLNQDSIQLAEGKTTAEAWENAAKKMPIMNIPKQ